MATTTTRRVKHDVAARQEPLRALYKEQPGKAMITDRARTSDGDPDDALHIWAEPGSQDYGVKWTLGVHEAVGGLHDLPNPGDLLCLSLAVCMDSVIRMIANRHGVVIEHLEVDVTGDVDVRGTLWVAREVRVGFQQLRCRVRLKTAEGTDPELVKKLMAASEHSCVNLDTLKNGVPVETDYDLL
jgi:uncharacterized OsmC-like protein